MKLADFQKPSDWVKVWSGKWSLHSDSNFGEHWTVQDKVGGRPAYQHIIYICKKGITDCWVRDAEKSDLGQRLLRTIKNNKKQVKVLADALKTKAKDVFDFIATHDPKEISRSDYTKFWTLVGDYYLPHLGVKYIVDYLSIKQLEKFLPILEDARLFSEPVFRETENYLEKIAQRIASQSKQSPRQILATTKKELNEYFRSHKLPPAKELNGRYTQAAILFTAGKYKLYSGTEVAQIEQIFYQKDKSNIIKGSPAYPGQVQGTVRIIIDPKKDSVRFKPGEILVTGMTRPEFLPVMKKAAAFITDAGGILSHAAIMAREMKKPCIIGTKNATQLLKDGDTVELNAGEGIIRKIS